MKISRLTITNFRGVSKSTLYFDGHTLLIGPNNVGKSTLCEAIDLVIGPDRLSKSPPLQEYDFHNAKYLEDDSKTSKNLRIEIVLTDISPGLQNKIGSHLEFWHRVQGRLLAEGEIDLVDSNDVVPCLRLETIGRYVPDEDEFEAQTFFSHSPQETQGSLAQVPKSFKRSVGFLYLRALRTGSRALSLERGSLLDIVLRRGDIRTELWERTIQRLQNLDPPIDSHSASLRSVLDSVEKRVSQYIPMKSDGSATKLFVSQLTREHLRRTMAFFLSTSSNQQPVPFQDSGSGTLNTLVLALLSLVADLGKDNVIFAMEEPETALPPHTQRRIIDYLLNNTTQCFVTSHSPYVIEKFQPDQIQVLKRSETAELCGSSASLGTFIKAKTYRKHSRRGLCEAMLGKAVIITEGLSEQVALWTVAENMEASDPSNYPLDLSGVTIFSSDGDGSLPEFGMFFKNLGIAAYAFYDNKTRSDEEKQKLNQAFIIANETSYKGMEDLLSTEVSVDHQWELLSEILKNGEEGQLGIPANKPTDAEVRKLCRDLLKGRKGDGTAGKLIELCNPSELPDTLTGFLNKIYAAFPRPEPVPVPNLAQGDTQPQSTGPAPEYHHDHNPL